MSSLALLLLLLLAETVLAVVLTDQRRLAERKHGTKDGAQASPAVTDEGVFARPRGVRNKMETVIYPQWLRIGDHTMSIEVLRLYDQLSERARLMGPFSQVDQPCTVRVRTYVDYPGKCVPLGRTGMIGCQTDQHIVPNHNDCRTQDEIMRLLNRFLNNVNINRGTEMSQLQNLHSDDTTQRDDYILKHLS